MKIHEITSSKYISEGRVDPNLMLSIRNIIVRGKATNTFEFIVVARLLEMLKQGTFYSNSDYNPEIPKSLLDYLRSLPDRQMVEIANQLWSHLQSKDTSISFYANPSMDYVEWLQQFFTSVASEAND